MITSVEIEGLRGIRKGRLEGLAPLTVLTGPNASGKSTVLDALLIAASPFFVEAIGRAVERHSTVVSGARWLCRNDESKAQIIIATDHGDRWERRLEWVPRSEEELQEALMKRGSPPPYSMIHGEEDGPAGLVSSWVGFGADNRHEGYEVAGNTSLPLSLVRLVDPGLPIPLHQTFSEVTRTGRRQEVHALLGELLPDFERLEIIALDNDSFGLAMTRGGRSIPLGLSGDGVQAFVQLALEVAVAPKGLVLIEEPEVYQHPKTLRQSARLLWANVHRGVQTVLTTHSLELIDALLGEVGKDDLGMLALFNLDLDGGELRAGRRAGEEIAFARSTLENDLR